MVEETGTLRLFIDSVDQKDWEEFLPTGIFYGITTNPKLLANAGLEFKVQTLAKLAEQAFGLGANEIHLQVWGRESEKMLQIGRELGRIDQRVMIKVPITGQGLLCARELISEGHQVTLTALHSANQILPAIAQGAKYAAPYLGRMNDGGLNGLEEIIAMGQIINKMGSPLRLLVASIRQVSDLAVLAESGLNTFTLLPGMIEDLLKNDLTTAAAEDFEAAAAGFGINP